MPLNLYIGVETEDGVNISETEKEPIEISVICAVEDKAPNFGYSFWNTNFVRIVTLNYSVNVKEDPCDTYSKDTYGITDLKLYRGFKSENILTNKVDSFTLLHESSTTAINRLGTITFSDQGNTNKDEEIYYLQ